MHTLNLSDHYNIRPITCSVALKTAITLSTVSLDLKYHFCCKRKSLSKILRVTFILPNGFLQLEDHFPCYPLITLLSFHYFLPLQLMDSVLNSHFSTDKNLSEQELCLQLSNSRAGRRPPASWPITGPHSYNTFPSAHWPPPRCSSLSFLTKNSVK